MRKIFVSSTAEDLRPYRQAAKDVVLDLDCHPAMMEHFGADGSVGIVAACKRRVSECDFVLAILGWRLGWVPGPEVGGDGKRSITQIEIETAKTLGKPIVVLLASDDWPRNLSDIEPEACKQVVALRLGMDRLAVPFRSEPYEAGADEPLPEFRAKVRQELLRQLQAPQPIPSYPSDEVRVLSEALEEAQLREETVLGEGGNATAIRREILDLRRQIREGGNVRAGDLLSGRFKLIELLGDGGFGTVWKAFDRNERQLVAVKVLHPHVARDGTLLDRFIRGARKMAELAHPGIVRVLENHLVDGGYYYFVMEYVAGGDLKAAVLEQRLAPERIVPLLREVADALQFFHDRGEGYVHRDVKPANILLDALGHSKLTDFDLVRAAVDTTGGTKKGAMLGGLFYSAPECLCAPHEAGVAADVYSLAMTAAFCFYGKELTYDILRGFETFLDKLPCIPGVRAALHKATAWEASERFPSVAALVEAIEKGFATPIEKHDRRRRNHMSPKPPAALLPYLEMQVANLPEVDRSGAVLERIERALSLGASDLTTLGVVAWALDYFPGRSARADEREEAVALRDRAFAPLRERCPPPPMPGRDDPAWAAIPGGSFWMGSPPGQGFDSERPTHQVAISPFRLGIHAVTEAEYARLAGGGGKTANLPVTGVDWYSAYAYAAWLGGRLSTEAEWEYAARGGTEYEYADRHGEEMTLDKVGWYSTNAKSQVQPVGRLEPNPWGLYDMIGNVWEWVADWFGPYSVESQYDPPGPASGERRVVRGGSASFDAGWARATFRLLWSPDFEFVVPGFRIALPAVPEVVAHRETADSNTALSSGFVGQPEAVSKQPSEGATLPAFVRSLPSIQRITTGVTQGALSAYLEKEVAHLPEADSSGAVLERIERALPLFESDLTTLGIVAWAVDYFPGRSASAAEREAAVVLRDRAFAPLRERCPPPPMPGRDDPAWAAIPGGSFWMGSPPEKGLDRERPMHRVTISPFRLAVLPVNEVEYARFMSERGKNPELPASGMDWYAAYAYAAWLGGRLPTESEWEYAARGGQGHEYADRDGKETTLDKVGWYRDTATQKPEPAGQLQPNVWGLYDMIGNVWEWVADWYAPYPDEPRTNPWGPLSDRGGGRVLRGGSAWDGANSARAAFRGRWNPNSGDKNQGFRVALPVVSEAVAPPETDDAYTPVSGELVDHPKAVTRRPSEGATLSALERPLPGIPRTTALLTKAALFGYLEKEVAHLSQAERSVAVLTVVERALPIDPKDRESLGIISWALDYFPGRSGHAAEREAAVALRDLAFGPLRKRCPPPPMPGCDDSAWAAIPGGSFLMGRPSGKEREDQRRIHEVTISPFR